MAGERALEKGGEPQPMPKPQTTVIAPQVIQVAPEKKVIEPVKTTTAPVQEAAQAVASPAGVSHQSELLPWQPEFWALLSAMFFVVLAVVLVRRPRRKLAASGGALKGGQTPSDIREYVVRIDQGKPKICECEKGSAPSDTRNCPREE